MEAAERYDQGDKRRAQNMLAQRALRARNKIVLKNVDFCRPVRVPWVGG